MIKANRRIPGTINSTPINKIKLRFPHNQNQNPILELPTFVHNSNDEQIYKNPHFAHRKTGDMPQTFREAQNSLIELTLDGKKMSDLERDLDKTIKLSQVVLLNLSNNQISEFPPTIFNKLTNLSTFYLSKNRVQKISFPYFKENKLTSIDVSDNALKSLNLEHVDTLIKLNCSSNQVSFLTLPPSLQLLNCSHNKLSNIYFMEHCYLLEEVDMSNNVLYDLKFNFKPYIKFKDQRQSKKANNYNRLTILNASNNKIQFIEGMQHILQLKVLMLDSNQICFTRHILNQLFLLEELEALSLQNNPNQSAYTQQQIIHSILSRLPNLQTLNGQAMADYQQTSDKCLSTQRKSHLNCINEGPYQLFMDSNRKPTEREKITAYKQWNFTLGDCQNQAKQEDKIQELSDIQLINTCELVEPEERGLRKTDLDQTYHLGLINKKDNQFKVKILKSNAPLIAHHVYYQQFLNALLPMSYVPVTTLLAGADYISGRRLECEDDEYILIDKMFSNRGGVSYSKKISKWNIYQHGREIFSKHQSEAGLSAIGFLLNNISQEQFRELTKFNRLIRKNEKDIIGMQPNAFTYFHVLVRHSPQNEQFYQCVYLVETFQL